MENLQASIDAISKALDERNELRETCDTLQEAISHLHGQLELACGFLRLPDGISPDRIVASFFGEVRKLRTAKAAAEQQVEELQRTNKDWVDTIAVIYSKLGITEEAADKKQLVSDCIKQHVDHLQAQLTAALQRAEKAERGLLPEGAVMFVPTGETRVPKDGDSFLSSGSFCTACCDWAFLDHPIYRRIEAGEQASRQSQVATDQLAKLTAKLDAALGEDVGGDTTTKLDRLLATNANLAAEVERIAHDNAKLVLLREKLTARLDKVRNECDYYSERYLSLMPVSAILACLEDGEQEPMFIRDAANAAEATEKLEGESGT